MKGFLRVIDRAAGDRRGLWRAGEDWRSLVKARMVVAIVGFVVGFESRW